MAHQVSSQRLALLLAVLESRCGIDTSDARRLRRHRRRAAGQRARASTWPSRSAVASASLNFAVPRTLAVMGEVGLAG